MHAPPGAGRGVVGHRVAQAVSAVGAGAHVIAAVAQVGQRAHGAVAGLELRGHQDGAGLVCELGCGERRGVSRPRMGSSTRTPRPKSPNSPPLG